MSHYLFSYSTLRDENVQRRLFGRIPNSFPDVLKGYGFSTITIHDPAFLENNPANQMTVIPSLEEDEVPGSVLELNEEELLAADAYEAEEFKRKKVILASGKEAWIFIAEQEV